jgi:hypothetical protein
MAKTYSTPTVAPLGAAEVLTHGLVSGTLSEQAPIGFPTRTKTTHAMLDL